MNPQNRIVHYVLKDGTCRPLLVTRAWSEQTVNGTLFIDGTNDYDQVGLSTSYPDRPAETVLTIWKTSVAYFDNSKNQIATNTWHWPEIAEKRAALNEVSNSET